MSDEKKSVWDGKLPAEYSRRRNVERLINGKVVTRVEILPPETVGNIWNGGA